jgi:hypothetical protein
MLQESKANTLRSDKPMTARKKTEKEQAIG